MDESIDSIDWPRIAARYALEILPAEEMKAVASALIRRGRWSDDIDALHTAVEPSIFDLGPHFDTVLEEEGVQVPSKDEAAWGLLRLHLQDIVAGLTSPREGLQRVMADVGDAADFHSASTEYVGDSHGMEHLVGFMHHYDDIEDDAHDGRGDPARFARLDKLVLEEAARWIAARDESTKTD